MKPYLIKRYLFGAFIVLVFMSTGCRKALESTLPTNSVKGDDAFSSDLTAVAIMNGIYTTMNTDGQPFQGSRSVALYTGFSSDELTLWSGTSDNNKIAYYTNNLSASNSTGSEYWSLFYPLIYRCNDIIAGMQSGAASGLSPIVKKQILGEAKFIRAYCFFNLVNLFGNIPLTIGTDPAANTLLARAPAADVYAQITQDLIDAKALLSDNYLSATMQTNTTERVRPTKWAASALLSRVYLFTNKPDLAEQEATSVINNTSLFGLLPSLTDVFLKNSKEAIWQLQPTDQYFNTKDAQLFVMPSTGPSSVYFVYLSPQQMSSFETGDKRSVTGNWITKITIGTTTYNCPYKYKINLQDLTVTNVGAMKEYFMMLRLGEQYLIRAEARAMQNNLSGAQSDLNVIRSRAGLANTTAATQSALIAAVLHERQTELFTESGHRWMDLKRSGTVDVIMTNVTPQKGTTATWQSYQQYYPVAMSELQKAPNVTQTNGY